MTAYDHSPPFEVTSAFGDVTKLASVGGGTGDTRFGLVSELRLFLFSLSSCQRTVSFRPRREVTQNTRHGGIIAEFQPSSEV